MSDFREWMLDQVGRGDALGDLASDVRDDRCAQWVRTPADLREHLVEAHGGVHGDVDEALDQARREWGGW